MPHMICGLGQNNIILGSVSLTFKKVQNTAHTQTQSEHVPKIIIINKWRNQQDDKADSKDMISQERNGGVGWLT